MQKIQKSKSFILPMFYFPKFINPHIDTYLGCIPYEGDMNWGDYFYVSCGEDCPTNVVNVLRNHSQYKTEFQFEDTYFYVFDITEKQKESIVAPFTSGAYSKIDREYVARCFPKFNDLGNVSTNWRILVKDDWEIPEGTLPLREYWFRRIGIEIPADMEVWDIPLKSDEVFGYEDVQAELMNDSVVELG